MTCYREQLLKGFKSFLLWQAKSPPGLTFQSACEGRPGHCSGAGATAEDGSQWEHSRGEGRGGDEGAGPGGLLRPPQSRTPTGRVGKCRPDNAEGQRPIHPRLDMLKVRFGWLQQLLDTRRIVLQTHTALSVPETTSAS